MKIWYLEGYIEPRRALQRIRISEFPFRVGRAEELSLVLDSDGISREHAELRREGDHLVLSDLNSTNGTFLNREPLAGEARIQSGDILHFANEEFRLIEESRATVSERGMTRRGIMKLSRNLPSGGRELQEMLLRQQVDALFQPIIRYSDGATYAWEMLGRGCHPKLPDSPGELFRIAESMGLEVRFSQLLRSVGIREAGSVNPGGMYFTNIHPGEMVDATRLLESLDGLRASFPCLNLVIEIHEAAVADKNLLQMVRDYLRERDIMIAYDDFGRGQARLLELADVPPDYIKLDMELIRDIDRTSSGKQQMVRMFAEYARDHGIQVIAEGVNTDGEIGFCTGLGIDLMQGYRFGAPAALPPA